MTIRMIGMINMMPTSDQSAFRTGRHTVEEKVDIDDKIAKAEVAANNIAQSMDTDKGGDEKNEKNADKVDNAKVEVLGDEAEKPKKVKKEGVDYPMFREMIKQTEIALLNKPSLKALVNEEYIKIREEADKLAPKIAKKLEAFREEMMMSMLKRENTRTEGPALEKRIQLITVSEAIDVPVNQLMMYFLNNVKTQNEHQVIEYHLGQVYFYAN